MPKYNKVSFLMLLSALNFFSFLAAVRSQSNHAITLETVASLSGMNDDVSLVLYEQRKSRLGIFYQVAIPDEDLRIVIADTSVTFDKNVNASLRYELAQKIRHALPQRINHELLKRILQSKNFSIHVSSDLARITLVDFFDDSNQLVISIKCFVDEAWVLIPKIGTGLSAAAWNIIDNQLGHDRYEILLQNISSALHQDYKEWSSVLNRVLFSSQGSAEDNKKVIFYQQGVKDFHPRLHQIPENNCLNFSNKIKKNKVSRFSTLTSYTVNNDEENKLYAPRQTEPYYTDRLCPSLMFHFHPVVSSGVELFLFFVFTYQKLYDARLKNDSKIDAVTQNLLMVAMTDAYSSSIKQTFFPRYCQAMTEAMGFAYGYCDNKPEMDALKKRLF